MVLWWHWQAVSGGGGVDRVMCQWRRWQLWWTGGTSSGDVGVLVAVEVGGGGSCGAVDCGDVV